MIDAGSADRGEGPSGATEPRLLSVITPCLNRVSTIARALDSVRSQSVRPLDHIVADGGSTDGTLELLARYPEVRVLCGPDLNLYDAINKALAVARGDVIAHLNADDWFPPGAFEIALAAFAADPRLDMVSGGAEVVDLTAAGGERVIARHNTPLVKALRLRTAVGGIPLINARFLHRRLYQRIGGYDTRFPIAADSDFLMRAHLAGARNHPVPEILYCYGSHPGSLTLAGRQVRQTLAAENLRLARTRCRDRIDAGAACRAAYRRWRAWAAGYQVWTCLRGGQLGRALKTGFGVLGEDPVWPFQFAAEAVIHWRERPGRR